MPPKLPPILVSYSMEMIRNNPNDMVKFSREYFERMLTEAGYFDNHMPTVTARIESFFEIHKDKSIRQDYEIGEQLSVKGIYSWRKVVHKTTGIERSVKIVGKDRIKKYNEFVEHIDRLRVLDHPNLCKIFDVYEDKWNFYFITELLQGGDLFDAIIKRDGFNEKDAAHVTRQLLSGMAYLHSKGITHRDTKAGLIYLEDQRTLNIKITDFEMAILKMQD